MKLCQPDTTIIPPTPLQNQAEYISLVFLEIKTLFLSKSNIVGHTPVYKDKK